MRKKVAPTIRIARTTDIPFILEGIREVCLAEKQPPEADRRLLELTKISLRKKEIRIISVDSDIAGFVQFKFARKNPYGLEYGDYERKYCWIEWLYIDKKFRRKGLASRLHNEVLSICKAQRIKEVLLDVFKINKSAIKFYEEEGFSEFIRILKKKVP